MEEDAAEKSAIIVRKRRCKKGRGADLEGVRNDETEENPKRQARQYPRSTIFNELTKYKALEKVELRAETRYNQERLAVLENT